MQVRSIVRAACIAALAAAIAGAHAQTSVYRWVDKDGKVHFSDTPPPPDAKSSQQKRVGGGYVETENLPYATQMAAKRNPVTLYTGAACGAPCEQARSLLSGRGIPYTERDAQGNQADQDALKKLIGSLDVPVLVIGESKIKGYETDQWQGALDGAGYPRTRLPGQATARRAPPPTEPPAKAPEGEAAEPKPQ